MDYDFSEDVAKIWPALMFMAGFVVIVGALLFVLDILPRWGRGKERLQMAGFLGPALILLGVGLVYPLIRTVYQSFLDASSDSFIGFENYSWIFTNDDTLIMLRNTLLWVVFVPSLATGFGLLYAVLVDKARGEGIAKSLIFMPMAISLVGASIIWKFIYAYRDPGVEQIGLLNQILVWFGGEPKQFLSTAPGNTFYMIAILIWIQAGFAMVILSAAIKAIPSEIVEAARLDGANPWQMFWRVTMPSIRPAVIVVTVTITIATLKVFDIVRTMTGGQFRSSVLAVEMYNQAFRSYDAGKGSALAVLLFVLVLPIVVYQARQLRQRTETR
ncbi:carbohydrate ABC transporter permease [Dactylosporangium matsuzakiense]|uniref:Alpha-glucoside ABC transporter permease n=1 Tax=Dactylosporangium matsuzakiense TaxID=53360 RepID=A0A9W6NSM0_9ACTN|nr:sugar ABC transporter permease [Dactylosporangium matsuzakiense]UWZ43864.1 sugar ABC transporter permease [Dactylosporangium matsuzakiense]GLL07481.1 alpha-glucoside ABC transporter permease [Dactylosporangium matsuzakiense]